MDSFLASLRLKDHLRIGIINSSDPFIDLFQKSGPDVIVDREIDPRYLYSFFIVFVKSVSDVNEYPPAAIHNLAVDGILWIFYPANPDNNDEAGQSWKTGWNLLKDLGFDPVNEITTDNRLNGIMFRNKNFNKSGR